MGPTASGRPPAEPEASVRCEGLCPLPAGPGRSPSRAEDPEDPSHLVANKNTLNCRGEAGCWGTDVHPAGPVCALRPAPSRAPRRRLHPGSAPRQLCDGETGPSAHGRRAQGHVARSPWWCCLGGCSEEVNRGPTDPRGVHAGTGRRRWSSGCPGCSLLSSGVPEHGWADGRRTPGSLQPRAGWGALGETPAQKAFAKTKCRVLWVTHTGSWPEWKGSVTGGGLGGSQWAVQRPRGHTAGLVPWGMTPPTA